MDNGPRRVLELAGDPHVLRHDSGSLECRLCLTVHAHATSYLAHAQGPRHQQAAAARAHRPVDPAAAAAAVKPRRFAKIGLPEYDVVKVRDPRTRAVGVRVALQYPRAGAGAEPRVRFMSAFEQQVEPVDPAHQYVVIAAEPYETVALRVPARRIAAGSLWTHFDAGTGDFIFQFLFES